MTGTIASLGPIMQLAYVPRDLDAALVFWTKTMGAGPFFSILHVGYKAARYRGQPSNTDFSVLIGYWGDLQIELIQQHDASPSIYKSWLDEGREGLHHVCLVVDDMQEARRVCAEAGAPVVQEIFMEGAEAIYVDTGGGPGTMVEILEPSPDFLAMFTMMRDAARDWDGTDPLRTFG